MKNKTSSDDFPTAEILSKIHGDFGQGMAVVCAQTRRILKADEAFCQLYGYSEKELLGITSFFSPVVPEEQIYLQEWFRSSAVGERLSEKRDLTIITKNGNRVTLEAALRKWESNKGLCMIVVVREKTQQKHLIDQLQLFQTITLAVSEAQDFENALGRVLRKVCVATGWEYGEAWVPKPNGSSLELCTVSYGAESETEKFRKIRKNLSFTWGQGLPGRAWSEKQPIWVEDIESDKDFRDKSMMWEQGFSSAMAIPALTKQGVVTILVFFVSKKNKNKELFIGLASVVAPQLGSLFQRKSAEEERDRFFSLSPNLLSITGFDGYFRQLSPAWEKTLGFPLSVLKQKPFVDWVHPDDREKTLAIADEVKKGGELHFFENRYLCKDGSYKWLLWDASAYPKEEIYYAIARDITERKKAQEELNRTNIFLDSIIENIPNMIFIKDAKHLRFIRFNKAGEDLLGLSRDKLIGKSDYDFFPKVEADFFTQKDRQVLENGELVDIPEEPIHTKKGVRILHTKKIPLLDENKNPQYLLGISEDITDKKK